MMPFCVFSNYKKSEIYIFTEFSWETLSWNFY